MYQRRDFYWVKKCFKTLNLTLFFPSNTLFRFLITPTRNSLCLLLKYFLLEDKHVYCHVIRPYNGEARLCCDTAPGVRVPASDFFLMSCGESSRHVYLQPAQKSLELWRTVSFRNDKISTSIQITATYFQVWHLDCHRCQQTLFERYRMQAGRIQDASAVAIFGCRGGDGSYDHTEFWVEGGLQSIALNLPVSTIAQWQLKYFYQNLFFWSKRKVD